MKGGTLHLLLGPMFAGKSSQLLLRLMDEQASGRRVQLFVYDKNLPLQDHVAVEHSSRSKLTLRALRVGSSLAIRATLRSGTEVVGIDDAHFADPGVLSLIHELVDHRRTVVVAGLDLDYTGRPFSSVLGDLACYANLVEKRTARCGVCGEPAVRTARIEGSQVLERGPQVLPGYTNYEPRCLDCFDWKLVNQRPDSSSDEGTRAGRQERAEDTQTPATPAMSEEEPSADRAPAPANSAAKAKKERPDGD